MNLIDVIVPCYGYGRYLEQCVRSVLDQGIDALRVLIIDDASPDETHCIGERLASADSRVTFVRHVCNQGHIKTYNEGLTWATSRYLLLLSADDYLLPGALLRATELLNQYSDMAFCFGRAIVSTESTLPSEFRSNKTKAADTVRSGAQFIESCIRMGANNVVATPTAVVRTSVQKQLGFYLPRLPHSGDFEMWLSLAARGSVGYVGCAQAVYRRHQSNMSMSYVCDNILRDLLQRQAAIDAFRDRSAASDLDIQALHRRLLFSLAHSAIGQASTAFNRNKVGLSKQLSDMALDVCPSIRWSAAWNRLVLKRRIGHKASRTLLPLFAILRTASTWLFNRQI